MLGEVLIDCLVEQETAAARLVVGGGPATVARTLARQGVASSLVTGLSCDALGSLIEERLRLDGVDVRSAWRSSRPPSIALALVEAGVARYRFYLSDTSFGDPLASSAICATPLDAPYLVTGGLTFALEHVAGAVLDRLAGYRGLRIVDLNVRPDATADHARYRERLLEVLRACDVVKASDEDLAWCYPDRDLPAAIEAILGTGPHAVIVTQGAQPVILACHAGQRSFPVAAVDVVDTVGAGDAFLGGVVTSLVRREIERSSVVSALPEAIEAGIRLARATCQRRGADPPWTPIEELP